MKNKPKPQSDSFERILNDLFKDLETVQGNRTTHAQLQRVEQLYRQRYENLKAEDQPMSAEKVIQESKNKDQ